MIVAQLHLWIGLVLCLPLVMLGLTGSILVFEDELEALFAPPVRPRRRGSRARSMRSLQRRRWRRPPVFGR